LGNWYATAAPQAPQIAQLMFVPEIDLEDFLDSSEICNYQELFDSAAGRARGRLQLKSLSFLLPDVFPNQDQVLSIANESNLLESLESSGVDFQSFLYLLIKYKQLCIRVDLIDYNLYLYRKDIRKSRELFRQVTGSNDSNGVSHTQLHEILEKLGIPSNDELINAFFREFDRSHLQGGLLTFGQVCCIVAKLTKSRKRLLYREFFTPEDIADMQKDYSNFLTDGKSFLGMSDLDRLFRKMGVQLKKEVLDSFFYEFDSDGSGGIDFDEFCVMIAILRKIKRKRRISAGPQATVTLEELTAEGLTCKELLECGYKVHDLIRVGFTVKQLINEGGLSVFEINQAGVSISNLKDFGLTAKELKLAGISATELRKVGFTAEEIRKISREITVEFLGLENVPDFIEEVPTKQTSSPQKGKAAIPKSSLTPLETKIRELCEDLPPHSTPKIRARNLEIRSI
jgi:Ca2+-binding EF-hand superfamily protein